MYTYNLTFSHRWARRGNAHTLEKPMKVFWRGRKIKVDGCISSERWCSLGYSVSVNYRAKPCTFCLEMSKNSNNANKECYMPEHLDLTQQSRIKAEHFTNQLFLLSKICKTQKGKKKFWSSLLSVFSLGTNFFFFFSFFVKITVLMFGKHGGTWHMQK